MCLAAESWKAVHLGPYITGGVQSEQCVPSFTEDTAETFFSLSALIRLRLFVCMLGCVKLLPCSEEDAPRGGTRWYVSQSVSLSV